MVASIGGDWRFVDCISVLAGKGRAMMYLASRFGIINGDVVAAGDSGNDLLMLGPVDGAYHPAIVMSNSHPEVCVLSVMSSEHNNLNPSS
jgi:hydroxymethylpyrimidine pyrophosphatase-like HAD family hydrolase